MGEQLLLLSVGFLLTGVVGAWLTNRFQQRAWEHQHALQQRAQERQQAFKTFEEVSTLLDKRLYRMRRLYWAAGRRARGAADETDMQPARAAYDGVLLDWNDNLNRVLALVHTYFGGAVRHELEGLYEELARLGRGLDVIVRMVSQAHDQRIQVPRFGHRITRLSSRVYALNVRMLRLLEASSLRERAPQEEPSASSTPVAGAATLEIGHQGRAVRRLQRALLRTGDAHLDVDGLFGQETWTAVRSLQESRRLDVDGIVGPATWAVLPSGYASPLLRTGSAGDTVAELQEVLAAKAPSRWNVAPEAANGIFDGSTSAAVRAFQRWNR